MRVDRYKVGEAFGVSLGESQVLVKIIAIRGQSVDLGITLPGEVDINRLKADELPPHCTPTEKA